MDHADYNFITLRDLRLLRGAELWNSTPRTLLLGDTRNGHTFHVYLGSDKLIHRLEYAELSTGRASVVSHSLEHEQTDNGEYIPDHRLNPAGCDFEVCLRLKAEELTLPFSEWDGEPIGLGPFFGKTLEGFASGTPLDTLTAYPPQWPESESPATTAQLEARFKSERVPYFRNRVDGHYLIPAEFISRANSVVRQVSSAVRLAA